MKPYFRSIIAAFVIAGLLLAFTVRLLAPRLPQVVGRPNIAKEHHSSWSDVTSVAIRNADGYVWVHAEDRADVDVHAELKAFAREDTPHEAIEQYVASLIQTKLDGGVLSVVGEPGERPDTLDVLVFFTLSVPRGIDVSVESASGNVRISGGCGSVTVRGRNADIQVEHPSAKVVAETINGRIRIEGAQQGGFLKTVNGSVFADVAGGFLQAETANGLIYAKLLRDTIEGCKLISQNGGITLVVGETSSGRIDAQTQRGRVHSQIPVNTSAGTQTHRRLAGALGAGGAEFEMATLNGDIIIVRSTS